MPPPWVSPVLGRGGCHTRSLGKWGQSEAEGEQAGAAGVGALGHPACALPPTENKRTRAVTQGTESLPAF